HRLARLEREAPEIAGWGQELGRPGHIVPSMAVAAETPPWGAPFAGRPRGDIGEGIAEILGLLGIPDLISFAGGFPDPVTFPRKRAAALLGEFAATGASG